MAGVRGRARATALLTALALLSAACEGRSAQPTPGPNPEHSPPAVSAAPGPAQPVALRLAVFGDRTVTSAYRGIARAFTATRPDVAVEVMAYPDAPSAAAAAHVALGAGGAPDVFLLDSTSLPRVVETGRLQPVDTLLEERGLQFGDDFQRAALTAFSADDRLQCMPTEMSPWVVYYNQDLVPRRALTEAGFVLPRGADFWTWDDFEAAARAAAGLDRLGPIKGTYVPPRMELAVALVRSAGAAVVDDELAPTTLTLATEEVRTVLAEVAALARDAPVSLTEEEASARDPVGWFTDGELGLLFGDRSDLPRLRAARGLRFDAIPVPSFGRSRSAATMRGLCVNAATEQVEAAADLVAFAVGERAAAMMVRTDRMVPSRLDALESPGFVDPGQLPRHPQAYVAGNRRTQPLPFSAQWPQVSSAAEEVLDRLYSDTGVDLGVSLDRRLVQLDRLSQRLFAPGVPPGGVTQE